MKTTRSRSYLGVSAIAVAAALSLAACGPQDGTANAAVAMQPVPATTVPHAVAPQPAPRAPVERVAQAAPQQRVASATLGEVRAIDAIRTRPPGSGTGAVVGGVLGAVLGNQIGKGDGRAAATVIGAVGGGVIGNNVERNHNEGVSGYRVRVQFDNGDSRTYEEARLGDLRVGDRVRVDGGRVRRV